MERAVGKEPVTFTDLLRKRFKNILDPIGAFLNRLGIQPNTITIAGLIGNMVASVLLGMGHLTAGGIIVLLMGPIDALDGTMARLLEQPTHFGGFVDSVTDRYSELVILGGVLVYFLRIGNPYGVALVYLAAAGSVLVSYIRARAQSAGYEAKVGLFTRVERFLVLAPGLIFQQPLIAVGLIAVFANITAFQRILFVRQEARARSDVVKIKK